jgi:hypothetical protein
MNTARAVINSVDIGRGFWHSASMKTSPLFLIAGAILLSLSPARSQVSAQQELTEAQQAYLRGELDVARDKFKMVLELDPQNVVARNYLHNIATAELASGKNGDLEKQLKGIIIPHVDLKDATFGTALEYLKQTAAKISPGTKVNFVVTVPSDVVDTKKITLNLSDVPFTEILHYLSELTGFQFAFEQHAIIVKQAQAAVAPPATTDNIVPEATPGLMGSSLDKTSGTGK